MMQRLTPHGPGFSFIDRFEKSGSSAGVAWKELRGDAPYFADHFPGRPMMPAVLLVECAAQAAGVLWMSLGDEPPLTPLFLAGIERFRVVDAVCPGAILRTEVRLEREFGALAGFDAECTVESRTVARGRILLSRHVAASAESGAVK